MKTCPRQWYQLTAKTRWKMIMWKSHIQINVNKTSHFVGCAICSVLFSVHHRHIHIINEFESIFNLYFYYYVILWYGKRFWIFQLPNKYIFFRRIVLRNTWQLSFVNLYFYIYGGWRPFSPRDVEVNFVAIFFVFFFL